MAAGYKEVAFNSQDEANGFKRALQLFADELAVLESEAMEQARSPSATWRDTAKRIGEANGFRRAAMHAKRWVMDVDGIEIKADSKISP